MRQAPQTPDGRITRASPAGSGALQAEVRFRVPQALRDVLRGREAEIVFAARSRLARLGINVAPVSPLVWDGGDLHLSTEVSATVRAYGIEGLLARVLVPGVRLGRLVFCPKERRLGSDDLRRAVAAHELQLPASYEIADGGRFFIRPAGHVYVLAEPVGYPALTTIVARADGKDLLNRIQVRRPVERIVLEPDDGAITSCSMFLHKHFVVLESGPGPRGQHLEAVVLDPVHTRGTNVFLEFYNGTSEPIADPAVAAGVYHAADIHAEPRHWALGAPGADGPGPDPQYDDLVAAFERLELHEPDRRYSRRMVAVVREMGPLLAGGEPDLLWQRPPEELLPEAASDVAAREVPAPVGGPWFGTQILDRLEDGARATLLLGYFPNLVEHTQICTAALAGKIRRLVFRRASYEHGGFFSARDHGRLADYEALGIEVFWCNDARRHVATHVFRGLRGFFLEPATVERFRSALIFAVYGSSKPLAAPQLAKMRALFEQLRALFGEDIAIMTGGGPGAMQQATDIAHEMGVLVGASFIETVDQATNQSAGFYQTFQGRSRQSRQRWFEVASFHLFFMGGVGTLEEVGLTLTDMKLGVIEHSPVVFFGHHEGEPYWKHQLEQFGTMVRAGRAPPWLLQNLLATDEAADIPRFYKRILELA